MNLVDDYYNWLKNNTFLEQVKSNVSRISLPFLNQNNDYIEIYVSRTGENQYILSDDGETLNELELSGFVFTPKRRELLNKILYSFGINISTHNDISVKATSNDLYIKKHMLVQCIVKINDLFYLKDNNIKSLFTEDVMSFLEENDIRYTSNISLIGKSKLPCQFDFIIPKSKHAPERLIKAVNTLDTNNAKLLIFNWEDTKVARENQSQLYAFVNNVDKDTKKSAFLSLLEYDIVAVDWTERSSVTSELSA